MKQLEELPLECKAKGDQDHSDGMYHVPHYKIRDYIFWIVFSSVAGWEHLSVSLKKIMNPRTKRVTEVHRCPTWEEMCMVKDLFWELEECVVQYHPPRSHYVNNHPHCLHLWKPTVSALPVPDAILVGIKDAIVKQEAPKGSHHYKKPETLNVDEGDE